MDLLKIIVFLWLSVVAGWAVSRLLARERNTVLLCLIVHWLFCGLPLFLDVAYGVPAYNLGRTIAVAAIDPASNVIYCAYVAAIPLVLWLAGSQRFSWRRREARGLGLEAVTAVEDAPRSPNWLLHAVLGLPLIAVLISPVPSAYLTYGFVVEDGRNLSPTMRNFYAAVQVSALLALIGAAMIVRRARSLPLALASTLPWVLVAIYVIGKRFAVAFYLALLTRCLWDRGDLRGARLPLYLAAAGVLMVVFSAAYQAGVRGVGGRSQSRLDPYENMRLDYGRDHTLKMAIHAELNQHAILDHRGQTALFYAGMYIPRSMWPEKPLPYAVYHTCYALGIPPRMLGWGLTTSIFDEAIANCGWLGMLVGPLLLGLCCRLCDRSTDSILRITGMLVCMLLIIMHLTAFMPLFLLWMAGTTWMELRGFFDLRPRLRRTG